MRSRSLWVANPLRKLSATAQKKPYSPAFSSPPPAPKPSLKKTASIPKATTSSSAAKSSPPAKAASSSTTSPPPSPSSSNWPPNWPSSTRKLKPTPASTRPSSASSSTALPASPQKQSPRPTPVGTPPRTSSTICSRASRTVSAWSISGAISVRKSSPPISSTAKTKPSKLKRASSPMQKSSTPPPWVPSISSMKAEPLPKSHSAPPSATPKSWPATTVALLRLYSSYPPSEPPLETSPPPS